MTRGKVSLAYIAKDFARKATFTERKGDLIKKTQELISLCEIEVCGVLFSPYDLEPEVWPSQLKAQQVIQKFRKLSLPEQNRRMVNQERFTKESVEKIKEKVTKKRNVNQQNQLTQVMFLTVGRPRWKIIPYTHMTTWSHDLRSSGVAEGIQCVVRMSSVAALGAFVRRTIICIQKRTRIKQSNAKWLD
ncbi:hypothetical protein Vadar_030664 [Vaccinium darrowii]|uniref:Uncharacterized protein n=1 Tax=Vaccinium darrowii TaxID=229202 RepID=A0ACB7X578_9ERIC|nr:hypothetical protein Vadar_030664 [Vaccinium darrowii]